MEQNNKSEQAKSSIAKAPAGAGSEYKAGQKIEKALVLSSGGVDSTTCLALAVKKFSSENVIALSVYYGQKHAKEVEAAKAVAKYYGVEHITMDLTDIFAFSDSSLLSGSSEDIPMESYAEQLKKQHGAPVTTYVPFRNGIFLSTAAAVALSKGCSYVYYGAHADDAAGNAYPDCSLAFKDAMNSAIYEGSGQALTLIAPFISCNKAEVVKTGLALGVPYELTWSCYSGSERPCGTCATCIDRRRAFEANGVEDPALNYDSSSACSGSSPASEQSNTSDNGETQAANSGHSSDGSGQPDTEYTSGGTIPPVKAGSDRKNELTLLGNKKTVYSSDYAPEVLETFLNKHPDHDYFVKFNCPEFTSLCPITGQPDFATVYISYVPDKRMVESKSLKLYLFSFRNHGDFHEDCMNIIMNDLIRLMAPKYIEVWGKFTPRGGISIDPYCNYGKPGTRWEEVAWQRLSQHDLYPEKIDNR